VKYTDNGTGIAVCMLDEATAAERLEAASHASSSNIDSVL
jgi:hypothetical protein